MEKRMPFQQMLLQQVNINMGKNEQIKSLTGKKVVNKREKSREPNGAPDSGGSMVITLPVCLHSPPHLFPGDRFIMINFSPPS